MRKLEEFYKIKAEADEPEQYTPKKSLDTSTKPATPPLSNSDSLVKQKGKYTQECGTCSSCMYMCRL